MRPPEQDHLNPMKHRTEFKRLLEAGKIGGLQLKNRMVMASMGTRLAGVWGDVNDATVAWYARRARGGAGLITVEATHVAAALFPVRGVVRMLRADDDCFCPGLFALAEAVHDAGAKISIQLSVGRAASTGSLWMPGLCDLQGLAGMAPSSVTFPGGVTPREMTIEEIKRTIELFGKAAARVKRVGFDAIELHAHFHSIPGCFLSPQFNKRTDEYGGNFENRLRFVLDIVRSMRERVGTGFPLMVKYSIDELVPGGRDLQDGLAIARSLESNGVDAIVVSQGQAGSKHIPYAPLYWAEGYMVPLAEALKKAVTIPVIVGGRLGDPALAERVLEEGKADFISLGRPLIADPDLPKKVRQGHPGEIRRCVADNWCFEIFGSAEMRCTLNAAAGRELSYEEIKPAERKKTVVIVGAGPAGMEAARVAGLRGHKVLLVEQAEALGGGELALAAAAPHKDVFKDISDYYAESFRTLTNVKVMLKKKATVDSIVKAKPDAVIIATGGKSLIPNIPGVDGTHVVTAFDVLGNKTRIEGKTVIVCGGNAVGCETASYLAKQGNQVTIVEMLDTIGADIEPNSMSALSDELALDRVSIVTGKKVVAITDNAVIVTDRQGNQTALQMDVAVLAVGVEPVNDLAAALAGQVEELYVIGDAKKPAKIHDAVAEAFVLAFNL
jgi:2,4-dienoyl-CoA reductase-like NADH-dependent reductase (Old Yellow Enzyme family)/thioredoxin reductase